MRLWLREIAGWLLVALGVAGFYFSFVFLTGRHVLEAAPMTFIGFILFRGGIHLLKVAVAAQVCQQAQERRAAQHAATPPKPVRRPFRTSFEGRL